MRDGEVPVYSPATVAAALRILAEGGQDVRPLAGGTDAMVKWQDGVWRPRAWVNLLRLRELAQIRSEGDWLYVGALATFSHVLASPLLRAGAPLLVQAARTIGGPQIRNMGTLGGNLGTASPAGDSLPALYALEARVHLLGPAGERVLPAAAFCLGPGHTALAPGELIAGVSFPAQAPDELYTYEKLGLRAAHAIAVASAAVRLAPGGAGGGLRLARVALGAVAPTVVRVPAAEAALAAGAPVDTHAAGQAAAAARAAARPITDLRGSAEYRRAMAANLVHRALVRLLGAPLLPQMGGAAP